MPVPVIGAQFLRFGIVGVANTAIDFAVLNALILLLDRPNGLALLGCNAVSFFAANLNSYFANRAFTFARDREASFTEFGVFLTIAFGGLLINSAVLWIFTGGASDALLQLNLAKAAATGFSMLWNFFGFRMLLMRQ